MMTDKKRSRFGLTVVGAVMGALAVAVGLFGLIPRMREKCIGMCEKMKEKGIEPPAFCKRMMEKCCGKSSEE